MAASQAWKTLAVVLLIVWYLLHAMPTAYENSAWYYQARGPYLLAMVGKDFLEREIGYLVYWVCSAPLRTLIYIEGPSLARQASRVLQCRLRAWLTRLMSRHHAEHPIAERHYYYHGHADDAGAEADVAQHHGHADDANADADGHAHDADADADATHLWPSETHLCTRCLGASFLWLDGDGWRCPCGASDPDFVEICGGASDPEFFETGVEL